MDAAGNGRRFGPSAVVLALLALVPGVLAVVQLGRVHPDEVFQVLEPAHYFAFGHGILSWEWTEGLRNWALPGVLGWLLRACAALRIDDPQARRAVLEIPQYALHLVSLGAVCKLIARRLEAPALGARHALAWALGGVALLALYPPVLCLAGRTLGEAISTSFMLWGLERIDAPEPPERACLLGGALLGLAVVARYGSIIVAAAAIVWLLVERRDRAALWVACGGGIVALLLGLLDWRSWGSPFHSLVAYARFNVLSDAAAKRFGAAPFWFYAPWLLKMLPAWVWPASVLGVHGAFKRGALAPASRLLSFCALAYLIAISCTAHKEVRFVYPAVVLLVAAVAPPWVVACAALGRPRGSALLALSLASGLALLMVNTPLRPKNMDEFQLFVRGVRTGHGIVAMHGGLWGTPGSFYAAGRPWLACAKRSRCLRSALRDPTYDRVVGFRDDAARILVARGFSVVERRGNATLWERNAGPQHGLRLRARR